MPDATPIPLLRSHSTKPSMTDGHDPSGVQKLNVESAVLLTAKSRVWFHMSLETVRDQLFLRYSVQRSRKSVVPPL